MAGPLFEWHLLCIHLFFVDASGKTMLAQTETTVQVLPGDPRGEGDQEQTTQLLSYSYAVEQINFVNTGETTKSSSSSCKSSLSDEGCLMNRKHSFGLPVRNKTMREKTNRNVWITTLPTPDPCGATFP